MENQFADRAKEMLEQFVQEREHKIASYYRENISGTKLDRPELGRLLMDSHRNDILLVEQTEQQRLDDAEKADRTTRAADCQPGCAHLMAGAVR